MTTYERTRLIELIGMPIGVFLFAYGLAVAWAYWG